MSDITERLTDAQKVAIIGCIDALALMAGEGFCVPEDAIYNLANAFDMPPHLEYGAWVRAALGDQP